MSKGKQRRKKKMDAMIDRMMASEAGRGLISSAVMSMVLREEHPVLFWLLVVMLLLVFAVPVGGYWFALEYFAGDVSPWAAILAYIGFLLVMVGNVGLVNLWMLAVDQYIRRFLGMDKPMYLGHKVTVVCLAAGLLGAGIAALLILGGNMV